MFNPTIPTDLVNIDMACTRSIRPPECLRLTKAYETLSHSLSDVAKIQYLTGAHLVRCHPTDEAGHRIMLNRYIAPRNIPCGPAWISCEVITDIALTDATLAEVGMINDIIRSEVVTHRARHDIINEKYMAFF